MSFKFYHGVKVKQAGKDLKQKGIEVLTKPNGDIIYRFDAELFSVKEAKIWLLENDLELISFGESSFIKPEKEENKPQETPESIE